MPLPAPCLRLALAAAALLPPAGSAPTGAAEPQCAQGRGGVCRGAGAGRPLGGGAADVFRRVRRALGGAGGHFPRRALELREVGGGDQDQPGGFGLFTRRPVKRGQLLIEVPLSQVLWRETVPAALANVSLPPGESLSDAERLVLALAILQRGEHHWSDAPFADYAASLHGGSAAGSTLLWSRSELRWLAGTDASELTLQFLSSVAHVHAAVPGEAGLEALKVAVLQYHLKHVRIWLGGKPGVPGHVEVAMVPGLHLCRHRDGAPKPSFDAGRRTVRLLAAADMEAGEEVLADLGARDVTDLLLGGLPLTGEDVGVFAPVPLNWDANGGAKAKLIERMGWPAEVRLMQQETRELRVLRLAAMPKEEFSAWSVGALAAGAPLAVSRAFRTEVQANAYLVVECARRHKAVAAPRHLQGHDQAAAGDPGGPAAAEARRGAVRRYRELLLDLYGHCQARSRDKLDKLRRWALRQPGWAISFVEEAIWKADLDAKEPLAEPHTSALPGDLPRHLGDQNVEQQLLHASVLALVNSRARDFAPYFAELLRAPVVNVRGFADVGQRLGKIKRLATAIVQLRSPACGGIDLSAFDWINELKGEEDVYTTLRYLLPEMEDLVKEFMDMEQSGGFPTWR